MDSQKIVERLEKDHPSPSLRLDDPLFPDVEHNLMKCKTALTGVCIPRVPETLLNSSSKDFFHETREKAFGKPLPQVEKEQGGEEAWMEALPALKELGLILEKNNGPFVLGKSGMCLLSYQTPERTTDLRSELCGLCGCRVSSLCETDRCRYIPEDCRD